MIINRKPISYIVFNGIILTVGVQYLYLGEDGISFINIVYTLQGRCTADLVPVRRLWTDNIISCLKITFFIHCNIVEFIIFKANIGRHKKNGCTVGIIDLLVKSNVHGVTALGCIGFWQHVKVLFCNRTYRDL